MDPTSQTLIPIGDASHYREHGLPWDRESQARWARRKQHENGLAGAFIKIGRNVHIDVRKFHELARRHPA